MLNQDQIAGQIRTLIPVLGTLLASYGITANDVSTIEQFALIAAGPIAYVIAAVWSYLSNSRAAVMASAAKPVAPGVPAPTIILPIEEKPLADSLPSNVTAKVVR